MVDLIDCIVLLQELTGNTGMYKERVIDGDHDRPPAQPLPQYAMVTKPCLERNLHQVCRPIVPLMHIAKICIQYHTLMIAGEEVHTPPGPECLIFQFERQP